jgi:hypothetical protein
MNYETHSIINREIVASSKMNLTERETFITIINQNATFSSLTEQEQRIFNKWNMRGIIMSELEGKTFYSDVSFMKILFNFFEFESEDGDITIDPHRESDIGFLSKAFIVLAVKKDDMLDISRMSYIADCLINHYSYDNDTYISEMEFFWKHSYTKNIFEIVKQHFTVEEFLRYPTSFDHLREKQERLIYHVKNLFK